MKKNRFNQLFWGLLFISIIHINILQIDVLDIIGYGIIFKFFHDEIKNAKERRQIDIILCIPIAFEGISIILRLFGKIGNLNIFTSDIPIFIFYQVKILLYVVVIYFICRYVYNFCIKREEEEIRQLSKEAKNVFKLCFIVSGIYQFIMPMFLNFENELKYGMYMVAIVRFLVILNLLVLLRKISKIDVNITTKMEKTIVSEKEIKILMAVTLCLVIGSWGYNGIRLYNYSLDEGFFVKQDVTIPIGIENINGNDELEFDIGNVDFYYIDNCRDKIPDSINVEFEEIGIVPLVGVRDNCRAENSLIIRSDGSSELIVPYNVKIYHIDSYSLDLGVKEKITEKLRKNGRIELTKMKILDGSNEEIYVGNITLKLRGNGENSGNEYGGFIRNRGDGYKSDCYYPYEDIMIESIEIDKSIENHVNVLLNDTLIEDLKFPMEIKENSEMVFSCKDKSDLSSQDKLKIIQGDINVNVKNVQGEEKTISWDLPALRQNLYNEIRELGNISK